MRDVVECRCCGGQYTPVQADGTRYAHVCPPEVDPVTGETRPRKGHRDENPALDEHGKVCGIRAEGDGAPRVVRQVP